MMTSKKKKGIIWGSVAVVLIVAVIVVLVCFVRFAPKINNELFKSCLLYTSSVESFLPMPYRCNEPTHRLPFGDQTPPVQIDSDRR